MSRAADVLAELRAHHCVVEAAGDRLRIRGPVSRLSDDLRARVAATKTELLHLLTAAPTLDQGLAMREVLSLRAEWLVGLPLPPILVLAVPDVVYLNLNERPRPGAFDGAEWLAMVHAAELGRARASDLRAWVQRKRREPGFRITAVEAAGGNIRGARQPMNTAQVLGEYGAELRAVVIDGAGEGLATIAAAEAGPPQDGRAQHQSADGHSRLTHDETGVRPDSPGPEYDAGGQ